MSLKTRFATLLAGLVFVSIPAIAADVVEYYHEALDHYFVTAGPAEIQALDSGQFAGWIRTGLTFQVYNTGSAALASSVPVCRYIGNPARGLNSHFYSASPKECTDVPLLFGDAWLLEADEVFRVHAVSPTTGQCPANTKAVYRLWNKRADSNHRYTTDAAVADAMVVKGYAFEGSGGLQRPIAFCAAANIGPAQPVAGAPVCTVTSSSANPVIGTPITLTATCTDTPTSYTWINCASTTNTCTASASAVGAVNYGVIGTNARGSSAPAMLALSWQNAASGTPTCTVAASSATPTLGAALTLTANCSHSPSRFEWMKCGALLIDACNALTECRNSTTSCSPVSAQSGPIYYALIAHNSAGASPKTGVSVNWQTTIGSTPPPPTTPTPVCTVTPSSLTPAINSQLTLTASCTNSPSAYTWTNCSSTTSVCTTTSATTGTRSYAVTATNASGVSTPASVSISWQQPPTAAPVCTLSASSSSPIVGTTIILTANCSQSPTGFQWTGCTSNGATCTTSRTTTGQASYSVVGSNSFGGSSPASVNVNWQAAPPGGTDFCSSYSNVIRDTLTAPPGHRIITQNLGGWLANGVLVGSFTTGANPSSIAGRASIAEYNGDTAYRYMTLSTSACDFRTVDPTGANGPLAVAYAQTPSIILTVALSGNGSLRPNTKYYINARNWNPSTGTTTCGKSRCDALLELSWPR